MTYPLYIPTVPASKGPSLGNTELRKGSGFRCAGALGADADLLGSLLTRADLASLVTDFKDGLSKASWTISSEADVEQDLGQETEDEALTPIMWRPIAEQHGLIDEAKAPIPHL